MTNDSHGFTAPIELQYKILRLRIHTYAGGNWVDQEMVRDRNWVTSRSPKDLGAFNPAMVSLFAESMTKAPQR